MENSHFIVKNTNSNGLESKKSIMWGMIFIIILRWQEVPGDISRVLRGFKAKIGVSLGSLVTSFCIIRGLHSFFVTNGKIES